MGSQQGVRHGIIVNNCLGVFGKQAADAAVAVLVIREGRIAEADNGSYPVILGKCAVILHGIGGKIVVCFDFRVFRCGNGINVFLGNPVAEGLVFIEAESQNTQNENA